ncbi:hypothetical protein ACFIOY_15000 [Bradyrhizobium sp. TZ2]
MNDPRHDPNDPAYYVPRELRERETSGQPDEVLKQAAEWRPRLTTEDPPQPLARPQPRESSEVFTKAVAQALQEQMQPTLVEAPSVLRDNSGRRALFNVAIRFSIAVAIAAGVASILVMAIPASQRPANDPSSISAIWQSVKSSVLPAPQQKRGATLSAQERSGRANDPLPLGIQVGAPFPGAIVAINGLPIGARLTSGQRIANEWHVPASEVSGVSVIPPNGFVGQMLLAAELRDTDGAALVASSTRLSWTAAVSAPPPPAAAAVVAAPVAVSPPPQAEIVRNLDPKEISGLVKRGQDLLASGDILSARLLLLRGAEARDARSALLLGTTYDPALLRQLGANGPLADVAQARNWYQKAREWGEPDAQRQLEALAVPR